MSKERRDTLFGIGGLILGGLALVISLLSYQAATRANELSQDANQAAQESNESAREANQKSDRANELSEEANVKSDQANRLSQEANEVAEGANELSEDANELSQDSNELARTAIEESRPKVEILPYSPEFSFLTYFREIELEFCQSSSNLLWPYIVRPHAEESVVFVNKGGRPASLIDVKFSSGMSAFYEYRVYGNSNGPDEELQQLALPLKIEAGEAASWLFDGYWEHNYLTEAAAIDGASQMNRVHGVWWEFHFSDGSVLTRQHDTTIILHPVVTSGETSVVWEECD